jgi:polyisoprenoid-binding protein YceI
MKKVFALMAITSSLLLCQSVNAKPVTFVVDDQKGRDLVSFTSDAPIELIVGRTDKISGSIEIDDSLDLGKQPVNAKFDVDLASIDTGIALRNEHMRDNFLETKKYPTATFKLKSLNGKGLSLVNGKTTEIPAVGEFTVHGKTVSKKIPVKATYMQKCAGRDDCDIIQIKATFPVSFDEHSIKRPEAVLQKLASTVFVTVSATAKRQSK